MARRVIAIEEKIEKQLEVVQKAKAKYDEALAELKALESKKDEKKKEELLAALMASGKSSEEIMEFLKN